MGQRTAARGVGARPRQLLIGGGELRLRVAQLPLCGGEAALLMATRLAQLLHVRRQPIDVELLLFQSPLQLLLPRFIISAIE